MVASDAVPPASLFHRFDHLPPAVREATDRVLTSAGSQLGHEQSRAAIARLLSALAEVIDALGSTPTEDVLTAPTDREALVRALTAVPPTLPTPEELEAQLLRDRARLRGVMARDRLLQQEGGVVPAGKAAELLGASRQTVNMRRNKGTLIGLKLGKQGHVYPVWQFANPGAIPGLTEVLTALRGRNPWTQTAFILNENSRLNGQRPLDLLRSGDVAPVVEAARAYGEQGGA